MALPLYFRTWSITANNRIVFVSLIDTTQRYLHGVKTFLKAHGYTVKGSASAGTGAMDGVDRWTATTDVTPRATIAGASQAWIVLTDGGGTDILITFQGSTDDKARFSFSPFGVFVAAGTANQQPTATDEQVMTTGVSVVDATTSADRLWFGWVSADKKGCRFGIARSGAFTGVWWGVERFTSSVLTSAVSPITAWIPVWGFSFAPALNLAQSQAGLVRLVVSSVVFSCAAQLTFEVISNDITTWRAVVGVEQGALGPVMFPVGLGSTTAGTIGKFGNLLDWWLTATGWAAADLLTFKWILIQSQGIVAWPWDGTTQPVLT